MLEKRHLFGRPDTKPLLEFRRDILELKSGTRRDANGHSALGPQLRWSWVGPTTASTSTTARRPGRHAESSQPAGRRTRSSGAVAGEDVVALLVAL
jgi:hypothetical protein